MKVIGITAEFNPFHNGHKYLIEQAKKQTNADFCVCIMSGSFTQNGNIAIYDKFNRAKSAIANGVDMVIELPTIYAISSSEFFATGAIKILNSLNIIDTICFGSECGDISILNSIADTIIQNEKDIWNKITKFMKSGNSFAKSRELALNDFINISQMLELSKPNNILAIEYIKALKKINSNITPITIKRKENTDNKKEAFLSATNIREKIYSNDFKNIEDFVPSNSFNLIRDEKYLTNEDLFSLIKYNILLNKENLSNYNGVIEGIENKVLSSISSSKTYDEFIHNIKSKRYAMSSIKRMLLSILLNITKEDFNLLVNNIDYANVLAISNNGKKLLPEILNRSNISLLTNINDNIISKLNDINKKSLNIDILATNIYSSLLNQQINKDYTNRL